MKEIMQKMIQDMPSEIELLEATVIEENPLKISIVGDAKRIISSSLIIVAQHLTNFDVEVALTATVPSSLELDMTETSTDGYHEYAMKNLNIPTGTLTFKNALKKDDKVICVASNFGQRYYILDRVG